MPLQISLVHQFEQQKQETWDVHFSWDGCQLVSSDGEALYLWQINEEGTWSYKQSLSFRNAACPRFAPDGTMLAFGGELYCLLAFAPNSRWLISCKSDGWIDLFSLHSFECIAQFAAHPGLFSDANDPIGGLDWSKTGYVATGGASVFEEDMKKTDYTIKIWKVEEK